MKREKIFYILFQREEVFSILLAYVALRRQTVADSPSSPSSSNALRDRTMDDSKLTVACLLLNERECKM